MNHNRTLFIMLSVVLFLSFSGPAFATDIIFACESKQDFPAIMGTGKKILSKNPGLAIEATEIICKKIGATFIIKRMPWKRCLKQLGAGKVDCIFTASFKAERQKLGQYPEKDGKLDISRRFSDKSYALYKLRGSPASFDGTTFFNIKGKIGAPAGYSIVDDLRKKGLTVAESKSTEQDFKKLLLGWIDGVAALMMSGDYYLMTNNEFGEKIEKVSPAIVEKPYYFIFSHQFMAKKDDIAEEFWNAMAELREDTNFKKRLSGYLQ